MSAPLPETFKRRHVVQEIHLLEKARGSGAILGSNGGGLPHQLTNLFGIAKSSVYAIVHDFSKAVHQVLMPDYIKLPHGDDLQEVLRGFSQRWGFPQCAGAIDRSSAARVTMTSKSH